MDTHTPPESLQRNPVTISMLFYVVTLGAIVSAGLRGLTANESLTMASVSTVLGVSVVLGLVLGVHVGIVAIKGWLGAVAAGLSGMLIGGLSGALLLINQQDFTTTLLISLLGCWLLIVIMLLAAKSRWQSTLQ